MNVAEPLHLILLVAVAGTGALCGFIASAVMLRRRRRARGYFILGVLTGLMVAAITHRRHRSLSAFGALAPGFVRPQRTSMGRSASRLGRRLRSHGQVIRAHTARTIATSARR